MNKKENALKAITRRHFFKESGFGIGTLALAAMMNEGLWVPSASAAGRAAVNPLAPKPPQFAPKAKNIIFLFMAGAPSHLDLLDYKPKLNEYDGQKIPEEIIKGERFAFIKGVPKLLGSPHSFKKYGKSGAEISSLLPHLSDIADDI